MSLPPKLLVVGDTYHRWTVVGDSFKDSVNRYRVPARCECGTEGTPLSHHLRSGQSKSCGCYSREQTSQRNRSESGNWRGGRHLNDDGYVYVYEPEHPNSKGNGYVLEHRLVMSKVLGRGLRRDENVHHINGNRQDNRPENLELWSTSQPPGQRVEEKLAWARDFIAMYGDSEK